MKALNRATVSPVSWQHIPKRNSTKQLSHTERWTHIAMTVSENVTAVVRLVAAVGVGVAHKVSRHVRVDPPAEPGTLLSY
jgi:hypothetical protein